MSVSLLESDNQEYLIYIYGDLEECLAALRKTKNLFLESLDKPIVVIDCSFEGEMFEKKEVYNLSSPFFTRNLVAFSKIHALLSVYPIDRTVLVYGDANLQQNYLRWCSDNNSVPAFGKCLYRPTTLLQRSLESHILNPTKPNLSFKSKHFICLNGVSKHHRIKMVNLLYEKDWQLKGHISWLRRGSKPNEIPYVQWTPNPNEFPSVQVDHPFNQKILKLDFDGEEIANDNNQLLCPPQYTDSCFDIVNETIVSDTALFITDKTWKPILQKIPFIIHGSKNSHKHLKEYFGIKPYTDLFDYRFDTLDYIWRFNSIKDDNLERLLNMDIHELNEIVNSDKMQDLLEYNKKQLLTHFIDKPITNLRLLGLSESGIGKSLLDDSLMKSLILLGY